MIIIKSVSKISILFEFIISIKNTQNPYKIMSTESETNCPVCVEKFNKTTRMALDCSYCGYVACRECYETYILQHTTPKCMSCTKEMNRDLLFKKFTKKFLNTRYKEHRENCLFDQEKAMLPATQPIVERIIENERIREEICKFRIQIGELQQMIRNYEDMLYYRKDTNIERKSFVRKCPNPDCRGFLSTQWKCNLCDRKTCKECNECIPIEDDEHKCDPNNVETAKLLARDSKTCPKCGEMIFKIDGCFARDTPILLRNGSIKMSQSIRIGDQLVGDDGSFRTVLDTCKGVDQLFKVEHEDRTFYIVNSQHVLVTQQREGMFFELSVDKYLQLDIFEQSQLYAVRKTTSGFKALVFIVTPVERGEYYGWKIDGNQRFLHADHR
jgi:hypothetical protein